MRGSITSSGGRPAGGKIAEVDYDTYAAGEAALGWLNASARLQARGEIDWKAFAGKLLEAIRDELRKRSAEIAHLKLYLTAAGGRLAGNVTGNDGPAFPARRDRRQAGGGRTADQRPRPRPAGRAARDRGEGVAGDDSGWRGRQRSRPCAVSSPAGRSRPIAMGRSSSRRMSS